MASMVSSRQRQQQLVRRVVGQRLAKYYAQPSDRVVGKSTGEPVSLSSLWGEWHWRRVFQKQYEEREGHWLTPVELFQPYYSYAMADFCISTLQNARTNDQNLSGTGSIDNLDLNVEDRPIEIFELGGGRGTNAKLVLSYLQEMCPELYENDNFKYTLVDSSPSLHQLQKDLLGESEHVDKVKFELKDLMDIAEENVSMVTKSDTHTIVLGCEVLDNLPHDKIQAKSLKKIQQVEVEQLPDGSYREVFASLSDPLLSKIIQICPSYVRSYPTWIPSVACGVLHHLIQQRPNLHLAFADFDWLPAPNAIPADSPHRISVWGEGEPIVTDMDGIDYECYLQSPQNCDILFPTDFDKLSSFVKRSLVAKDGRANASTIADGPSTTTTHVQVEKQSEFLERYGSKHVRATKSWLTGYTPLLHDFSNCSVLTVKTGSKSRDMNLEMPQ